MTSHTSCRLFVYLARKAPLAVVLRRSPSDWARLSLWHTDTDKIEHGQWLKGRVYERRCDVSADGSLFLAFVRQSGGRTETDTWLALSRPPYFSALAVWLIGGTYHTGGFFPGERSVWTGYGESAPDKGELPGWLHVTAPRDIPYIDGTPEWTDRTVHLNRLLRDGWGMVDPSTQNTVLARRRPEQPLTVVLTQRFAGFEMSGGPYEVSCRLQHDDGTNTDLGIATWADWDQRGRLVLAREGKLFVFGANGFEEIADFNAQEPVPEPAPGWAMQWPDSPTR